MAYGVRYRAEWRATTRGERYYVLDILKNNYTGSISPMYLTGECVTITYGEVDESELQPIKSSEAEISVLCTEAGNPYMELFTLDPAQYQVQITENGKLIWQGYLATGDYQQPLSRPPYTVRFRANDGLGVLKAMPYLDSEGNRFVGVESISALIRKLLSPISNSVDIWGYNQLYYGQTSFTFDIAGIPNESIYRVFSNDEPTYYDVLEAVLKNFGVQLFQQDAKWCVRSIGMLATAVNSELLTPVALDDDSTAGLGIKADATLSFLSPLRKLIAPERTESNSVEITDIVSRSENWNKSVDPYKHWIPKIASYNNSVQIYTKHYSGFQEVIYSCATLLLQPIIHRSQCVKLSLSLDIHTDETIADATAYIGVWLVTAKYAPDPIIMEYEFSDTYHTTVTFPRIVRAWDAEKKEWKTLSKTSMPTAADLGMQKVVIPKAEVVTSRPMLSTLPKSSITLELPNIPTYEGYNGLNDKWQLAIAVSTKSANVYISNPVIVFDVIDGMAQTSNEINISKDGISDENYDAKWRSATEMALSADAFAPSLVNVLNAESQIYGYIEATSGVADKDVVGKMLSNLRGRTTRVIEGEVDKSVGYGLNDVFTYDSRYYYANHVKKSLKRGISSVQLRELPQLTDVSGGYYIGLSLPKDDNIVSVRNTFYWLTSSAMYRYDIQSQSVIKVRSVGNNAVLSAGVNCVTIAEKLSDTTSYAEAYNDQGKRIANAVDFAHGALTTEDWVTSARYDAVAEVWLAHNGGSTLVMCDKEGYVIGRWELPLNIANYSYVDVDIKPYNGGFVTCVTAHITTNPIDGPDYYAYWHCYAIHATGEYEADDSFVYARKNILMVNERFAVCMESNRLIIYHRDSVDMGPTATINTYTLPVGTTFGAANNAIVVVRDTDSNRLYVYDARNTAKVKYYAVDIGSATSKLALCEDIVIAKATSSIANRYQWVRIIPNLISIK